MQCRSRKGSTAPKQGDRDTLFAGDGRHAGRLRARGRRTASCCRRRRPHHGRAQSCTRWRQYDDRHEACPGNRPVHGHPGPGMVSRPERPFHDRGDGFQHAALGYRMVSGRADAGRLRLDGDGRSGAATARHRTQLDRYPRLWQYALQRHWRRRAECPLHPAGPRGIRPLRGRSRAPLCRRADHVGDLERARQPDLLDSGAGLRRLRGSRGRGMPGDQDRRSHGAGHRRGGRGPAQCHHLAAGEPLFHAGPVACAFLPRCDQRSCLSHERGLHLARPRQREAGYRGVESLSLQHAGRSRLEAVLRHGVGLADLGRFARPPDRLHHARNARQPRQRYRHDRMVRMAQFARRRRRARGVLRHLPLPGFGQGLPAGDRQPRCPCAGKLRRPRHDEAA